jgi:hypothetical protein
MSHESVPLSCWRGRARRVSAPLHVLPHCQFSRRRRGPSCNRHANFKVLLVRIIHPGFRHKPGGQGPVLRGRPAHLCAIGATQRYIRVTLRSPKGPGTALGGAANAARWTCDDASGVFLYCHIVTDGVARLVNRSARESLRKTMLPHNSKKCSHSAEREFEP